VTIRPDARPESAPGNARAAARVGAGIFVSRVLGLVRERVFAYFFGSGDLADAWRAALRLPNVIRNLLGEGSLSASVIPVYAGLIEEGREEDAGRFAGAILGILAIVAGAIALLGVLIAPVLVRIVLPEWDPAKQAITITLVRILFPMVGMFVISAWAMSILDSHRRFFVSYVAPALWNVALITAMIVGGTYWLLDDADLVVVLAWGALIGGGLQLGLQLPFVLGHVRGLRLSLGRGVEGVSEAVANFWPVMAARGVVNLSSWFEVFLAGFLASGAIAVLGYAQTLYLLPISLFGISVAASELPELSRMREEERQVLAGRVSRALRRVAFFLVPSALVYVVLGEVAVGALFQTGDFGEAETLVTWAVLALFALGLPASASSRALSSAFYALRDTRTPARIAYLRVVVSTLVGLGLMFPADGIGFAELRLGAAGLAGGATAGAWMEYVLLRRALGRKIGPHGPGLGPVTRLALSGTVAAGVAVAVQLLVPPAHPILVALETLVPFGVVYLAVAALLGERIELRRSAAG
jgi:putative peptidoglycan lipid II flippase